MSRIAIGLIRLYQRYISGVQLSHCRFQPTCSEYSAQAINHFGVWVGGFRTAWRILRCNPMNSGGYDPAVPDLPSENSFSDRRSMRQSTNWEN